MDTCGSSCKEKVFANPSYSNDDRIYWFTRNQKQQHTNLSMSPSATVYKPNNLVVGHMTTSSRRSPSSKGTNCANGHTLPSSDIVSFSVEDEAYHRQQVIEPDENSPDRDNCNRKRQQISPTIHLLSQSCFSPRVSTIPDKKQNRHHQQYSRRRNITSFAIALLCSTKCVGLATICGLSLSVIPFLFESNLLIPSPEEHVLNIMSPMEMTLSISKTSYAQKHRQQGKSENSTINTSTTPPSFDSSKLFRRFTAGALEETVSASHSSAGVASLVESNIEQPNANIPANSSILDGTDGNKDSSETEVQNPSKYAYVYMIGGVDVEYPAYRGFLYNIMISTYLQRRQDSKTIGSSIPDVVVMIKMMRNAKHLTLPLEEEKVLTKEMNIKIQYIAPKPIGSNDDEHENFNTINMEKFLVWNMTQYERIIYLDSDMLLVNNLDYFFDMSVSGVLQSSIVMAQRFIPAGGNLFLLKPCVSRYQQIMTLIKNSRHGSIGYWNYESVGWGQRSDESDAHDDYYELSNGKIVRTLEFPGFEGDQGLLWYITKYMDRSVSVILKDKIRSWNCTKTSKEELQYESTVKLIDLFSSSNNTDSKPLLCSSLWSKYLNHCPCLSPFRDFVHFQGLSKPWLHNVPFDLSYETSRSTPVHYWYYTLGVVNDEYNLGLNLQGEWIYNIRPLLGLHPVQRQQPQAHRGNEALTHTERSSKFNRTVYEDQPQNHDQPNDNVLQVKTSVVSVNNTSADVQDESHPSVTKLSNTTVARFAYAYVVGGCDPDNPAYRNYIYDILISTYNQRAENSQADVVILFQMLYKSRYDTLPPEDVRILQAMNIKAMYIPKSKTESFFKIMLDKFRILDLTDYERVMFMDSDVMAMGSLDYIFELSTQGVLKKNVIFAGVKEPANGGCFMLEPSIGAWSKIVHIISAKEQRGSKLPYPHWDEFVGWGHQIDNKTDYYQFVGGKKQTLWNFYGSFADQGLLYHWVKYEEKSVSIIFKEDIQNWDSMSGDGVVSLVETIGISVFDSNFTYNRKCWRSFLNYKPCSAPHGDFIHFTGVKKPWLAGPPTNFLTSDPYESASHYWFHILSILNKDLELKLDFNQWEARKRPLLGLYPKHNDAAGTEYMQTAERLQS